VSHQTSNTDTKVIALKLDQAFIDTEAMEGELCSLRVTQYGDMRSFISSESQ